MIVVLCAILRTENRYLAEWLDYHLNLGFDHIYLCDNAQEGEERAEEIVNADPKYKDVVTVFPYFNLKAQQVKAYTECYKERGLVFDWMAFLDIDEFLTFSNNSTYCNIHDYLDDMKDADEVLLNWMTFGDNGWVKDNGQCLLERFTTPLPLNFSPYNIFGKNPYNCHVKQLLRNGLPVSKILPHASEPIIGHELRVVDGDGQQISPIAIQPKYTFLTCYVRHFYTKSIEEFIKGKLSRRVGGDRDCVLYDLSMFFLYNRITMKKLKIYNEASLYYECVPKSFMWWIKQTIKMYLIVPLMYVFEKK